MTMRTEKKSQVKNSAFRLIMSLLSVLFQLAWLILLFFGLTNISAWISLTSTVLALFLAIGIYGNESNASMKMPWIIVILAFPVTGIILYLSMGKSLATKKMRQRFNTIDEIFRSKIPQDKKVSNLLESIDLGIANQCKYIYKMGHMPIYNNTDITFYKEAYDGLKAMKSALIKAKHFIFMEYHAIEDAISFGEIKNILTQKAKEGVEIRILYDDIGSIFFLNKDFIKDMRADGIDCRVFNPVNVVWNMFMNNRDHRKIMVVDGKVAFTGGYNLADEYFNYTHPYGHWKDTGIRLRGKAVRSMTAMFLEMWNSIDKTDADYAEYLEVGNDEYTDPGFVQPYYESPMRHERIGENVYLNFLKNAKKYCYITTPYLIITDEMARELILAAKRGVDVRIVTPGIPDKKVVFQMTRSYYANLTNAGVRIYEYTPGFMHSKQWVSDDCVAIIGTINMDFRSLYHHFENAVYIYNHQVIDDIKQDFMEIFDVSNEVTDKYKNRTRRLKYGQSILRLFSPLM